MRLLRRLLGFRHIPDLSGADDWFERGVDLLYGRTGDPDSREAFWCLSRAAELGHAEAQFNVGLLYHKGEGTAFDVVEALRWYHRAASQGHADAYYQMGSLYSRGEGVPRDRAKAFAFFHEAATRGHVEAQFHLGIIYDEGRGVRVDVDTAEVWYRKAADQGHEGARWRLAHPVAQFQLPLELDHRDLERMRSQSPNARESVATWMRKYGRTVRSPSYRLPH